jgi:arylformamidase
LSPLRLPAVMKPLAITYGTAELPALVEDSRDVHAHRSAAHAPGPLVPIEGADHFTILEELRRPQGKLVRAAVELAAGLSRRD